MELLDQIKTIGVLGAGQMGSGIAQVAAGCGLSVLLVDAKLDLAEKGKAKIAAILGKLVEKGKFNAGERESLLARSQAADRPEDFAACDFVIEAATENFDLKVALLRRCDAALLAGKWLASNTSSISLTKLAAATSRPDR